MKAQYTASTLFFVMLAFAPQAFGQAVDWGSRPKIIKAELRWHKMGSWPPAAGIKTIPVHAREQLCMLSAAIDSIQQWDDRFLGIADRPQDVFGELLISTENSRFRIRITRHAYYFDADFRQFRHHFYSIALTNVVERILRESHIYGETEMDWQTFKELFDRLQRPALTGERRLEEERREWSEIVASQTAPGREE